jgi:uncharacterized cupredoxin-like copper-binding protein
LEEKSVGIINLLVLAFGLVMVLAGCTTPPEPTPEAFTEDPYFQAHKSEALADVIKLDKQNVPKEFVGKTIDVYLSNFKFDPDKISLKSGTITRVRVYNIAWVTHYFGGEKFFAQGAEVVNLFASKVPPGQYHIPVTPFTSRDIYLYAKEPGEYLLNCYVTSHRIEGMSGVLIVEK